MENKEIKECNCCECDSVKDSCECREESECCCEKKICNCDDDCECKCHNEEK